MILGILLFLSGMVFWGFFHYLFHRMMHRYMHRLNWFGRGEKLHHTFENSQRCMQPVHSERFKIRYMIVLLMGALIITYFSLLGIMVLGFVVGLSIDLVFHTLSHNATSSWKIIRYLQRRHMDHHKESTKNFGVGIGIPFDFIFGTEAL